MNYAADKSKYTPAKEDHMPDRERPLKARPKEEDESTGKPTEHHGKHNEQDEALPGKGGEKGGLNKQSGGDTQDAR